MSNKHIDLISSVKQKLPRVSTGKIDLVSFTSALGAKFAYGVTGVFAKFSNLPKMAQGIKEGVSGLQVFLLSILILVVCIAVIALIYIIARVVRLRGFSIFGHSENVEEFMETLTNDMDALRKLFLSLETVSNPGTDKLMSILGLNKTMTYFQTVQPLDIKKNFDIYFKYKGILNDSFESMLYSGEIDKTFGTEKVSGMSYLKNLVKPIDDVRQEVKLAYDTSAKLKKTQSVLSVLSSLSEDDYASGKVPPIIETQQQFKNTAEDFIKANLGARVSYNDFIAYVRQMVDLCIGVNLIYLYLHVYFTDIIDLHRSRRFSFYNLLFILLKPYMKKYIFEGIIDPAKDIFTSNAFMKNMHLFTEKWDAIGPMLVNLPKTLAEGFEQKQAEKQKQEEKHKPDVIEGFGFLKGLLSIGEFFKTILELAIAIAGMLKDPIGAIFYIIKLIVGTLIGLVLLLFYALLSLPPFIFIVYGIYYVIFVIVAFVVGALFNVLMFTLFCLLALPLWILDLLLSAFTMYKQHSFIMNMGRCENLPDMWYKRSNFVEKSQYSRSLFCLHPCSTRFEPNGVFCSKMNSRKPSFCPQAQIYRMYRGDPITPNPSIMNMYSKDLKFIAKSKEEREHDVRQYFYDKQDFLQKCSKVNQPYDNIVKTVCENYNVINSVSGKSLSETERKQLKGFCKQVYCQGQPKEDFCYKYNDDQKDENDIQVMNTDDILRRIMKLFVLIVISVIVILMFLYNT